MKQQNKTKTKGRKRKWNQKTFFFLFLLLLAVVAGLFLYRTVREEQKEENRYEQMDKEKNKNGVLEMGKEYPDMIGWLEIKNTSFSYPVMQTKRDPEYYLHRDERGRYSFYGTPFLDARCSLQSDNLIVYGHNINGRRFFGFLQNYGERSFYEKHKNLTFTKIRGAEEKYAIVAVVRTDICSTYYQQTDIYNEDEYWKFVRGMLKDSLYSCDEADILEEEMKEKTVEAFFHSYQFLCLSTCRSSEGKEARLLVIGCRKKDAFGHYVQT